MSVTITFYGIESDEATQELRHALKSVPTAFYDDYRDYFILYQVRYIRSEPSATYICFESDVFVTFTSKDYDIAL